MNQAKLCGLIVLLCVICPVMVGYAWPVNAEDETIYNVQNTTNITKDFTNGKINTYAEFTDVYANNYNMFADMQVTGFDDDDYDYYGQSVIVNKIAEAAGQPIFVRAPQQVQFTNSMTINNLRQYITNHIPAGQGTDPYSVIISARDDAFTLRMDNLNIDAVVYYMNNDSMQIVTSNGVMQSTTSDRLIITASGTNYLSLVYMYLHPTQTGYADLSGGFRLYTHPDRTDSTVNTWYNGYTNNRIDILLKTDYDMDLKIDIPRVASLVYHVYITENGQIQFRTPGSAAKTLGDVDTYPYVLLRLDAINQKISLSGMTGMKSFTDPYESLMRHTIEVDLSIRSLTHLFFTNQNGSVPIDYFIPTTISSITSVDGINAAEQNLRGYTGGDFQLQFKMPQFVSSGNGAIDFGPIEGVVNDNDKTITWTVGTKTVTAPIKDTYLLSIGRDLYINGELMYSYPSYQSEILLKFYGQWLMQLYYSDLDSDTKPSYTWLPGGFGLNEVGFCVVGLMTAAGSGTAAMLAGRRSGTKAGLALLVAGCCGAFYIMEIMNFM